MPKEFVETLPEVEFREVNLTKCEVCEDFRGSVIEEYNDNVPVLCRCDRAEIMAKTKHYPSPSMYCRDGKVLWWTPLTDHLWRDRWWHTPHFGSPPMRIKIT
ncbi:hypothetical protein HYU90_02715 [Candidatus Collierbacteria bacterium]|nr:hypothetical protein [Candidatus Collierbacteria bacterium]